MFVLVPQSDVPHSQRPLKRKLVCKHKCDDTGKVVWYKVQYVAKGFAQHYGIDYDKTTTHTMWLKSFCTILHLATTLNWDLKQFDIKTAFLHGILPEGETMYMEQPSDFTAPGKEEWVMQLMKSIYSMKQASWIWNQMFHKAITKWGFEWLNCEWCVYHHDSPTGTTIFVVTSTISSQLDPPQKKLRSSATYSRPNGKSLSSENQDLPSDLQSRTTTKIAPSPYCKQPKSINLSMNTANRMRILSTP